MSPTNLNYYDPESFPVAKTTDDLRDCLIEMNKLGCGFCVVLDEAQKVVGLFTDGDLRRRIVDMNLNFTALMLTNIENLTSSEFQAVNENDPDAAQAVMEKYKINELPVVSEDGKLIGLFRKLEIR